MNAEELRSALAYHCGSETVVRHSSRRIVLTEGVVEMRELAQAYWLVDAIASHQIAAKVRTMPFQVWTLRAVGAEGTARLTLTDGNGGKNVVSQRIEYTDFPLDKVGFSLWLVQGVLMLPGEY